MIPKPGFSQEAQPQSKTCECIAARLPYVAPKVCALRMAMPGPSPPSALKRTLPGRHVLTPEALVKVADRQAGRVTLSKGPRHVVLPRGEPNIGDRMVSSLKCPKLLRGAGVTEAAELK